MTMRNERDVKRMSNTENIEEKLRDNIGAEKEPILHPAEILPDAVIGADCRDTVSTNGPQVSDSVSVSAEAGVGVTAEADAAAGTGSGVTAVEAADTGSPQVSDPGAAGTGASVTTAAENSDSGKPAVQKRHLPIYLDLFLTFAGVGVSTFGGGYAMLPILQREICDKRGWATEEELMDYYAIGQCTPGVIAVNTATFVGYKKAGVLGGICATLGVIFPSIVIICVISAFLKSFAKSAWAIHAFNGIRAAVCVLILDAVVRMGKKSLIDKFCIALFLAILVCSLMTSLSPILYVLLAGALGVLVSRATKRSVGKDSTDSAA